MAKEKLEPIIIADELPQRVAKDAPVAASTGLAIETQKAHKAPSIEAVRDYWTPGREPTKEIPALMAEFSVTCGQCSAMLPYIPVAGEEPPSLICETH